LYVCRFVFMFKESDEDLTPYAKLLKQLKSNHEWQKQISLGKRIGLYRIHEELGSGNFAQVKAATHCLTKGKVAIKIIDKGKLDQKTHRMLTREISTMEALHHPNAIRLYEVVETLSKVYLVMEFAEGGELFKRISSKGAYPERDAKIIFTQICSAVDHMHKQNIVHRDLKAENVFLAGNLYVKVGDYGFSTTISFKEQLTTFCGSPPYAAPELFREEKYPGPYVDIWALGVMLYFIVSALMPFTAPTVSALRKLILEGQYEVPSCVSSECQDLIQGILQMVPQNRLTLAQIQSHRFLYGVIIPTPLDKYNICPRIEDQPPDQSSLQDHDLEMRATGSASAITIPQSKEEIKVRKQLNEFGITDKMMAECQYSGAKSMVTGTYRILLHRLQLAAHSDELYGAVPGQLRHPSRFHVLSGRNKPRQDLLGPSSYSGDNFTYTQNRIRRSGPLSSAEPEIQLERQSGLTISKACAVL
ncbi:serine/threonine-protein kinase NIM1-like, partial [Varroa jacobsoni]|uniref:serine/threonine-protein kinase NIM1-like n=1 Tax=Varroa jacobsoni TaxID=62625 RepID=UPI000BF8D6A5